MHEIKDEELFSLAKAGNEAAFTVLVERYQELLFMEANRKLQSEDEAKDAVQEVFIWLWLKKETVELQLSLRNYLFGAIRNYCLNVIRRQNTSQKRKSPYIYIKETFVNPTDLENKELAIQLHNAIDNIQPAGRAIFKMQYIQGISQKEIALRKGIGLQTVKNHIVTALKTLRHTLKNV